MAGRSPVALGPEGCPGPVLGRVGRAGPGRLAPIEPVAGCVESPAMPRRVTGYGAERRPPRSLSSSEARTSCMNQSSPSPARSIAPRVHSAASAG